MISEASKKIQNTKILPLRWFANLCGEVSGFVILKAAYLEENNNFGLRHKVYSFIYSVTWPVYFKFGTFYEYNFDMNGDGWNDYDENGIPYWEKTGTIDPDYNKLWNYIDEETGDAFRVLQNARI